MESTTPTTDILPNPIFEGSEKRLEVHFTDVDPSIPSISGLRAIDRSTLDSLMELAACEIVSCTSNAHLDAYVLSESSLFVYPRTWVLKTCGTTKLLNCLEKLLEVAMQLGLAPCYGKYSRASFLYPELQPEEYKSFDAELEYLRTHLGHIGHGGSAFVLGDKLHGLQWHLFVVSEEVAPTTPSCMSSELNASSYDGVSKVPLHTMEVCMTDLQPDAAQQFVRTEAFVNSKHTTRTTGIRALMPNAEIDDYVFEPCGYSMNGIDGSEHMTIHVTPEEGFSYASCEIHGFDDRSFDTTEMATSIVSIFRPGRLVVACATKADANCSDYLWASTVAVPGYSCAGATCQELPTGGRIWFYSLVRDSFQRCPRTLSCPARLSKWPSFATRSLRKSPSDDRMDTLTPRSKRAAGTVEDSGSSGSEMDVLDLDRSPTAAETLGRRRCDLARNPAPLDLKFTVWATIHPLPNANQADVLRFAERLVPGLPQDLAVYLLNLAAVSSAVKEWQVALPDAAPLHTVAHCQDSEVLGRLHDLGAAFVVSTPSDMAALCRADLNLDGAVMHAAGWRPRDIMAASSAGARLFAVSSVAELTKLQRFAPAARLLLVVRTHDDHARCLAVAAAAARIGLLVCGVLVSGNMQTEGEESAALVRAFCADLEEQGHALEHVMIADTEGMCAPTTLAAALKKGGALTSRPALYAGSSAFVAGAVTMLTSVHTVDDEGVHVTGLPDAVEDAHKPDAVLVGQDGARGKVVHVLDGMHRSQFVLPPVQVGDWLAVAGGGILQDPCDGPVYYLDLDDRYTP